jgi:hypothetical protein
MSGKTLDEIAIVYKKHPHGYMVFDLDTARAKFAEQYDVDLPWRE